MLRMSWPMWLMLALALAALAWQWVVSEAYYYGWIDFPSGDGTPARWVGW